MKVLSLKLPEKLDRKLSAVVRRRGTRKSAVVREALERYVDESREIRKGSFLDLAGDLIGCVKDTPADLSSNPKYLDRYLFQLLPLAVQSQQGADLEITCSNIKRTRDSGPLAKIVPDLPVGIAVIDDEQIIALPFR